MLEYLTWNTVIEIVCFLIALLALIKDRSAAWKGLIVFLFITCVAEITGKYIVLQYRIDHKPHHNTWVYSILLVFEMVFTSSMFFVLLKKTRYGKFMITYGLALLGLIYIYETFRIGFLAKHNLTTTVMAVLFVTYSLAYFYTLLKSDVYVDLKFSSEFWWISGSLFFYFGSTMCNLFYYKLSGIKPTPEHNLVYYIYCVLNLLMYGFWSYSFICRKWMSRV